MRNDSPLRFPGGKSRISDFIREVILLNDCRKHYVEPFAGGAGIALSLLFDSTVDRITINDKDPAIYSFWYSAVNHTAEFCEMIEKTSVTIEERTNQYNKQKDCCSTELERGFSTFFLNRTNRSGVIDAGPIGGFNQNGNYKIDVRFNKAELISRIERLGKFRERINVTNEDAGELIRNYLPKLDSNSFVYLDPPYYKQGPKLYLNHYSHDDHVALSKCISQVGQKWAISYDNVPEVRSLYSKYFGRAFSIGYSVVNGRVGPEVMYFSDKLITPVSMGIVNGTKRSNDIDIIAEPNQKRFQERVDSKASVVG